MRALLLLLLLGVTGCETLEIVERAKTVRFAQPVDSLVIVTKTDTLRDTVVKVTTRLDTIYKIKPEQLSTPPSEGGLLWRAAFAVWWQMGLVTLALGLLYFAYSATAEVGKWGDLKNDYDEREISAAYSGILLGALFWPLAYMLLIGSALGEFSKKRRHEYNWRI